MTKGSNGIAAATIPNVCKMPGPPAPFVPAPLPNIGKSGDSPKGYSQDVTIEGKAVAIKGATFNSIGDMASKGTGGGLISANTHGITKFVGPGSMDVKIEGKNVQLLSDPMLNNCAGGGSPPNAATLVGVVQDMGLAALWGDERCPICGEQHGPEGRLEESPQTSDAVTKVEAAMAKGLEAAKKVKKSVYLTAMVGAVKCKHADVYVANSSAQFREIQSALNTELPNAHAPKASHDLATQSPDEEKTSTATSERFARHAGLAARRFRNMWKLLESMSKLSARKPPETDEVFYPPGFCAAQQAFLHSLEHGHSPKSLTERRFTPKKDKTFTSMLKVRELDENKNPLPPTYKPDHKWDGSKAVPPCGTCQVMLTMLMCIAPVACSNVKPPADTCHKC